MKLLLILPFLLLASCGLSPQEVQTLTEAAQILNEFAVEATK